MPVPLDVIECWDRNVSRSLEQHVLSLAERGTEVTVVMARRDFPTSVSGCFTTERATRSCERSGRYPHVDVARVPYFFAPRAKDRKTDERVGAPAGVR